jgi:hypothetical protein
MALERVLGEAVLRVCYIFDAEISPARMPVRMPVRMAAYQLEAVEDQLKTTEAFGRDGIEEVENHTAQIYGMHALLAKAGFECLPPRRREVFTAPLSFNGQRDNVDINATDGEPPIASHDEISVTVALSILELADSFAHAAEGFTGVDIEGVPRGNHQRRMGLSSPHLGTSKQAVHYTEYGTKSQPRSLDGSLGASFRRA